MLAHGCNGLCMGRLRAGPKQDRDPIGGSVGNRIAAGKQDYDPVSGRMLDRNAGQSLSELPRYAVRDRNAVLLAPEATECFIGGDCKLRRILDGIFSKSLGSALDRLRSR
jgi:hypothetical protein